MTTPGIPLQVGDLKPSAQSLAGAAQGYQDSASLAPEIPNAGQSTASVGQLLVAFATALSQCAQVSARSADAVQACDVTYTETDEDASRELAKSGEDLGGGR